MTHWQGFRFWMAHTPYLNSNNTLENPSILASQDGVDWVTPQGLTNPIYPRPSTGYNSDADLSFDAATGELVLVYRGYDRGGVQYPHLIARSPNGRTWPAEASPLQGWAAPEESLSPALVQTQDGWLLFGIGVSGTLRRWTAPAPEGPWSGPTVCSGLPLTSWHLDVTRIGSALFALIDEGMEYAGPATNALYVACSIDDGLTWTRSPRRVLELGSGRWDSLDLYRGTLQPHENGTHMRVWYSGRSGVGPDNSWHVGLTHIPLTEWPTPA